MEIELAPTVAAPIVRPDNTTVTKVLAAINAVVVVMTMLLLVGVALVPVGPAPLICTPGVADVAKKPNG